MEETDFIIGDRVFVGTKPGIIAYLGDVKFANGDFAGVVLDEAVGKNDGSVKGTRYFQCDSLRGVFVRAKNLVRNMSPVSNIRSSPRCSTLSSLGLTTPSPTARSPVSRSPAPRSPALRKKSSSSNSSGTRSATPSEEKNFFAQFLTANGTSEPQTGDKFERIQSEYTALMSGTKQKMEEFQQHVDKLEIENKELHKTIEEQKQKIEDLQFQLEEEVLSKEDVMQELVNEKNNNKLEAPPPSADPSAETQLANDAMLELERQTQEQQRLERLNKEHVEKDKEQEKRITELQRQLEESLTENKELNDTLSQATNQLSDIEFQLAEMESEKENTAKEKKKLEGQISDLEEKVAHMTSSNQQDNQNTSQAISQLNEQLEDKTSQLETLQESCSKSEAKANNLREKIKKLEIQHNQDTLSINHTHENITTSLHNKYRLEIGTLRSDHTTEMELLQEQHLHDISNQQEKNKQNINRITAQHNQDTSDLQNQLDKLQRDYEKQTTASNAPCSQCALHESLLDNKQSQINQLRQSGEEQLKLLNAHIATLTEEKLQLVSALASKSHMTDLLKQQVLDTQNQLVSWQRDVKEQVESNKQRSEKDLESLKSELLASQGLLVSLEKKLGLSEKENSRLNSRVNILTNELNQTRQALVTSPSSNSVSGSSGTYRDTSDFLFNQLKRQVEVMEVRLLQTTEEDLRLKDENDSLRAELSRVRQDLNKSTNSLSSSSSPTRRSNHLRLFCDICGVFDIHNTSECLKSTTNTTIPLSPQNTIFCNICQSHAHWTADCTVDE